jgi:hypothetical protein
MEHVSFFDSLMPGDWIARSGTEGADLAYVIIRFIDSKAVIGSVYFDCDKWFLHEVYDELFSWDKDKKVIVNESGIVASFWSEDLVKKNNSIDANIVKRAREVPVTADYVWFDNEESERLLWSDRKLTQKLIDILATGTFPASPASHRRALECLGVFLSDDKWNLLYAVGGLVQAKSEMEQLTQEERSVKEGIAKFSSWSGMCSVLQNDL